MTRLPAGPARAQGLRTLFAQRAAIEPGAAFAHARQLEAGALKNDVFGTLTARWVADDPRAALAAVRELPAGGLRSDTLRRLIGQAERSPREAADHACALPEGDARGEILFTILYNGPPPIQAPRPRGRKR